MAAEGVPKKTYDFLFKLLLVGDAGVGKTSILLRFVDDIFHTSFVATIGVDFKIKTVELNGKEVKLQIWDTYGGERFRTITSSYFRGAAGIIMVYDMTDEKSFEHINSNWLKNVQENTCEDVQKVLLANKCDLDDQQMVSKEKGESFAQENGMRFFETSAKTNINIETAVLTLVEDIIEKISFCRKVAFSRIALTLSVTVANRGREGSTWLNLASCIADESGCIASFCSAIWKAPRIDKVEPRSTFVTVTNRNPTAGLIHKKVDTAKNRNKENSKCCCC